MSKRVFPLLALAFVVCSALAAVAAAERSDTRALLAKVRAVESEGKGHAQAQAAWRELAQLPAEALPEILAGINESNPLAANWLRSAVDAVAERTLQAGGELPAAALERFLLDTANAGRARRLAYELLAKVDPAAPDRLLPRFVDDPSLELRRDAVERLVQAAEKKTADEDKSAAIAAYRTALDAARDLDQVTAIAKKLKELGAAVNLGDHFGFIRRWSLIGPFDNSGKKGFEIAYAPEEAVDVAAALAGSEGQVKWAEHETTDELGVVDLNKAIGKHKGAVAYAWCRFDSNQEREAEIRYGSINANKVFLNGQLVSAAEVYHAAQNIDQYVGKGKLKKGPNEILVKICQNEQTEEWAQNWMFQLRVADALGKAIHPANSK